MCEPIDQLHTYHVSAAYKTLRKKLDNLGYSQTLPLDALPLVQKLLADLIQTTASLRHFKAIAENNIENLSQSDFYVEPYRQDNAKLTQECNQLSEELIEVKETNLKVINDLKRKINRLESECNDLQLASAKNLKRIKDLEVESSNKSKRIQELLGKCCKPTISNVGLATKRRTVFPLKKPILEADTFSSVDVNNYQNRYFVNLSKVDPHIVDIVEMGDKKINSLLHEVKKLKEQLSLKTDNLSIMNSQLMARDKEISRLKKSMENGRAHSVLSTNCNCGKNDQACSHCHSKTRGKNISSICARLPDMNEVKILQQAKLNLEQQLRDALDKQHDAMSQAMKLAERNEELEKELKDIDHIALAVEADCNTTVKENNKKISQLQDKLEKSLNQISELENNLLAERRMCQELRADVEAAKNEKRNIQRALDNALEENKQLLNKIKNANMLDSAEQGRIASVRSEETHKKIIEKNEEIKELEKVIQHLEREKNHFKNEWNKLKDQQNSNYTDNTDLYVQICDLKHQLNEREAQITELKREKTEISCKKLELENMYRMQVQNACDLSKCKCHQGGFNLDSGENRITLSRLERERDKMRNDLEIVIQERDIIREKLRLATGAHTAEQKRLKEKIRDLEMKLDEAERQRQDILLSQGSQRTALTEMEDIKEELHLTRRKYENQRNQYSKLVALQEQTDQTLNEIRNQLAQSEAEISRVMDRNRTLEQQHIQLNNQVKNLKQEINTLQSNMNRLHSDKDQLVLKLDEKTERIADLESELMLKEQQRHAIEQQLREIHHKNAICVDQSADQERRLRDLEMEIDNYNRQLLAVSSERDNVIQENKRLQNELAALTCEIKSLQRELNDLKKESSDLKKQLQTYVSKVRYTEELLNDKEKERSEMLHHFKNLSLETTALESDKHSLKSEAAEAKEALRAANDRLDDLERELANKNCLIAGYENQISELTKAIARLETDVRQQVDQKDQAETDLNGLRDLCVKLEQQKETYAIEIGQKNATISNLEGELARLEAEYNINQNQKSHDQATIDRLQSLLDQARLEAIEHQQNNQKLHNEIDRLKQKTNKLQNELSNQSAELKRWQNQTTEYSNQISQLRRAVTDEQFNRAKQNEEQRRNLSYSAKHLQLSSNTTDDLINSPPRSLNSSPDTLNEII
ncbi:centrosomal protein of 135 kDa isoform X2 [Chelonus insularis]|uniref:centrosomal protein of 135 kDa isoform X2 n=1 Tax=Chelonus insularis TaxID=460826 RepID=UPI00158CF65C|nr:centrosomal protein of 135 kDa isoform X2 [Chelonus insularis]